MADDQGSSREEDRERQGKLSGIEILCEQQRGEQSRQRAEQQPPRVWRPNRREQKQEDGWNQEDRCTLRPDARGLVDHVLRGEEEERQQQRFDEGERESAEDRVQAGHAREHHENQGQVVGLKGMQEQPERHVERHIQNQPVRVPQRAARRKVHRRRRGIGERLDAVVPVLQQGVDEVGILPVPQARVPELPMPHLEHVGGVAGRHESENRSA